MSGQGHRPEGGSIFPPGGANSVTLGSARSSLSLETNASEERMDGDSANITSDMVEAARRGDEAAARQLIDHLYPTVISIVRNHLPWSEQEEDLAQDIFLKFFAKLDQFRGDKPVRHWVGRIALFTCYDALRKQRNRRTIPFTDLGDDHFEVVERALQAERSPERGENARQAREVLDHLLLSLKPEHQMVIRLLDIEQRPVKDVCALTGWGESRVRVTALRARRKLGEALARMEARTRSRL